MVKVKVSTYKFNEFTFECYQYLVLLKNISIFMFYSFSFNS